eukprot:11202902-Lingulodinium_polyedra.AAC.1
MDSAPTTASSVSNTSGRAVGRAGVCAGRSCAVGPGNMQKLVRGRPPDQIARYFCYFVLG